MYRVLYQFRDKAQEIETFRARREAFAARNRKVKSNECVYAEVIDLITLTRYGYGVGAEERLLAAIFDQPPPTEKHHYLNGQKVENLT